MKPENQNIPLNKPIKRYSLYDRFFPNFISTSNPSRTESLTSDLYIGVNGRRKTIFFDNNMNYDN